MISLMRQRERKPNAARQLKSDALSVQGKHREHNEDSVLVENEAGIFVVADGMGGHHGGSEASEFLCAVMAGELLEAEISEGFNVHSAEKTLKNAVQLAIDGMRHWTKACPAMQKMGSTLVIGWFVHGKFYYGHVGDSRLYLLRNGKLRQLTRDHSFVEELGRAGAISASNRRTNRWRNLITRNIGPTSDDSRIDVNSLTVRPGDRLIFLTDGITDVLANPVIHSAAARAKSPNKLCRWLVTLARAADAHDDLSCIVVDC